MKLMGIFAAVVAVLSFGANADEGLIPEIKFGDASLKISGWGQIRASQELYGDLETDWAELRVNADLTWQDWEFFTQLSFATTGEDMSDDWLYQAWAGYDLGEHWKLRVGRLFVSGGNITPSAYSIRIVEYPSSITFPVYAWGGQLEGEIRKGLTLITEVTGKSGVAFNASDAFERVELGLMLRQEFGENGKPGYGYMAGYGQFCQDFQHYGVEGFWQPTPKLTLMGAGCYTHYESRETSDEAGGYALVAYRLFSRLEPHVEFNYYEHLEKRWHEVEYSKSPETSKVTADYVEYCSDSSREASVTIGAKFWPCRWAAEDDRLSLTGDYEIPVEDEEREPRWLAKVQLRF